MSTALDENAVLLTVENLLRDQGYHTRSVAAGHRGIDLEGVHPSGNGRWYIEGKGATSSRAASPRFGQEYGSAVAFDRVAKALLTACYLRQKHPEDDSHVGIAIPATRWFNEHSSKIEGACAQLRITIFRVAEDAEVTLSGYIPQSSS